MLITDIIEFTKNRSKIYIDNEFAFVLYKGEIHSYKLAVDKEITTDIYREIMTQLLPKRARLRAINLLKSREYTVKQLENKLRQSLYPEEIVSDALDYVASFRYVDDVRYATDYITYNESIKSRKKIENNLLLKGISRNDIESAWEKYYSAGGMIDEVGMIKALIEKKHFNPENADYKEKQKIYGFLMRKGFEQESIRRVISDI